MGHAPSPCSRMGHAPLPAPSTCKSRLILVAYNRNGATSQALTLLLQRDRGPVVTSHASGSTSEHGREDMVLVLALDMSIYSH